MVVLTEAAQRDLVQALRAQIAGDVRFDEMTRGLYSTDASIYQIAPVGVVFPKGRDDVLAAVNIARQRGLPVLPRGSGTSLSGQTVAAGSYSQIVTIVVDF